jgi:hypothetical protein
VLEKRTGTPHRITLDYKSGTLEDAGVDAHGVRATARYSEVLELKRSVMVRARLRAIEKERARHRAQRKGARRRSR